jgi:phage gpG-like protein
MAGVTVQVDDRAVQIGLGDLRAAVTDYPALLRIAGNLMRGSVAHTFRDEGSPAGSWPRLALSTLKKKGYTAGHKLLIMSGRLFGSITYLVTGNTLTVGTNVVYAGVHQFGSADRSGGSIGAQAKIAGRGVKVSAHDALRVVPFRKYGKDQRLGSDGKTRSVRVRAQGPDAATRYGVKAHTRHQNIPARPFLVFRPEDPQNIASGMEAYLRGRGLAAGGAL